MSERVSGAIARFADAQTMPWLGGGGVTHELAREPADGDFGWRLSVAEVQQDGPFSRIDGVDRVIVLCTDRRMVLHTPDSVELQRFSPYSFDGGTEIACSVPDGPTHDFNVMTRRGVHGAQVATVVGARSQVEANDARVFVCCLDGTVSCAVELGRFDLVEVTGEVTVDATQGAAAVVTLRPA